ncbi:hypothetical protein PJI16_12360 [Nitrospira sp. MA-1]|nr:hypothetical protein [Nitrospira sp. MA-1]
MAEKKEKDFFDFEGIEIKQGEKMHQATFAAFPAKALCKSKKKFCVLSEEEPLRLKHLEQHNWATKHTGWRQPAV